jgi:hypothetical protein
MALSTTTTATHHLLKYSKCNPSGSEGWQHFVNPTLSLILDITKQASGEPESVRLRIVWVMSHAAGEGVCKEVVFVSATAARRHGDVMFFVGGPRFALVLVPSTPTVPPAPRSPPQSSLQRRRSRHPISTSSGGPTRSCTRLCSWSLTRLTSPLNCRFLFCPSHGKTYGRFQITFQSTNAASQFIDSIRNVCPCKVNTPPAPGRAATMIPPAMTLDVPSRGVVSSNMPPTPRPTSSHMPTVPSLRPATNTSSPFAVPSLPASSQPSAFNLDMSSRPSTSSSLHIPNNFLDQVPTPQTDSQIPVSALPVGPCPVFPPVPNEGLHPSPPISSLSGSSSLMAPPPPPNTIEVPASETFLEALRESAGLHEMPREDLERLVGTVIREPGFVKLVGSFFEFS